MKRVIIVAVTDEIKAVSDLTLPKMRAYADRCKAELIVLDGMPEKYQHPKYRMFEAAEIEADRYLIVDADILMRDSAPDIFETFPEGNWMLDEGAIRSAGTFDAQKEEICGYADYDADFGVHWWNPGVALLNRDAVKAIYRMPPWDVTENLFTVADGSKIVKNMPWINYRIAIHAPIDITTLSHHEAASAGGIRMNALPIEWNCFVNPTNNLQSAYFWHCAGSEISKDGMSLKEKIVRNVCRIYGERLGDKRYHAHFVIGQDQKGWILGKMLRAIIDGAPQGQTHSDSEVALDSADVVNVHIPYRTMKRKSRNGAKDIVFCTHPEVLPDFYDNARKADGVVVMCRQYRDDLIAHGVDASNVTLIYPGVDMDDKLYVFNPSRMTILEGYTNRKGVDDWNRLCGIDWLECCCSHGNMTKRNVWEHYRQCDCVVSTATMEGGPMSLIEAGAHDRSVYARAGVGFADDFPEVRKYRDIDDLIVMLEDMHNAKMRRMRWVETLTWQAWSDIWWKAIERVAG